MLWNHQIQCFKAVVSKSAPKSKKYMAFCDDCHKMIEKKHFFEHQVRHHMKGDVGGTCDECNTTFPFLANMWFHQRIYHLKGSKFHKTSALKDNAEESVEFVCDDCDQILTTTDGSGSNIRRGIMQHRRLRHQTVVAKRHWLSERLPTCEDCGFFAYGRQRMIQHIAREHSSADENGLLCADCPASASHVVYFGDELLTQHWLAVHHMRGSGKRKAPHRRVQSACDDCDTDFSSLKGVNIHIGKARCRLQSAQLKSAVADREASEVYCDECDFVTMRQKLLRNHMKCRHWPNWVAEYQCDECCDVGKSVVVHNKETLKTHFRAHHQPIEWWQFACDECALSFACRAYLTQHTVKYHMFAA